MLRREMEFSLTTRVCCWKNWYRVVGIHLHTFGGYAWQAARALLLEICLVVHAFLSGKDYKFSSDKTSFYVRNMYHPISDVFNRPIASGPGPRVDVVERQWVGESAWKMRLEITDRVKKCLNLSSYNYLGFGGFQKEATPKVAEVLISNPVSLAVSRRVLISDYQIQVEEKIAKFIGKEAAIAIPMGFCTNAVIIPHLAGFGCLVLSDSLNHASIITGAKLSSATVRVFKHNDMDDLQHHLEQATKEGISDLHKWRKILIIVEGLYSMEGELCPLPKLVALKKRYGAYLYVDEAHSIGAMGPTGRGVCEYYGIDPADVDILMGTFTKSFAAIGGYIGSSLELVQYLRNNSIPAVYGTGMAPACAAQISSVLDVLLSDRGRDRIFRLRENSIMFRKGLENMGCMLLGPIDSPVAPIMLHHPCKITAFSRQCMDAGIAVVCVGYPATSLLEARARFCISAMHTTDDLNWSLQQLSRIVSDVGVDYWKFIKKPSAPAKIHKAKDPLPDSQAIPDYEPLVPSHSVYPPYSCRRWSPRELLCSFDFLGLSEDAETKSHARHSLLKYGCGSCGPRGFYGTTKRHLKLDKALAIFTHTEQAFSRYGLATMSSVIPAILPSVIVYDSAVHFPIQMGVMLAKCPSYSFVHNDMKSLEKVLTKASIAHRSLNMLLVTEAIFFNTGEICPLPEICLLKDKYGFTLLVDESLSFGVLGSTGRGLSEHYTELPGGCCSGGIKCKDAPHKPLADIMVGSLEYAAAAMGGFCCGATRFVGTQPLTGAAYCFSAAMPPFMCTAAVDNMPKFGSRACALKYNSEYTWDQLACSPISGFIVQGSRGSPVLHLRLQEWKTMSYTRQAVVLEDVRSRAKECGLDLDLAHYSDLEVKAPAPSIMLCINVAHSHEWLDTAIQIIRSSCGQVVLNDYDRA